MDLPTRLTIVMQACGWTRADLKRESKQTSSVVSQWMGKGSRPIKSIRKMEAAENLARASGFNALWIATGMGAMRPASAPKLIAAAGGQWPFKRITSEQITSLDDASLNRLETMIEAVISGGPDISPIPPTTSEWRGYAMQIAGSVDAVTGDDKFRRFVQAVDQHITSQGKTPTQAKND